MKLYLILKLAAAITGFAVVGGSGCPHWIP